MVSISMVSMAYQMFNVDIGTCHLRAVVTMANLKPVKSRGDFKGFVWQLVILRPRRVHIGFWQTTHICKYHY